MKLYYTEKKKNVCIKIIGPRFWQGIYLIQSPLLEHYF